MNFSFRYVSYPFTKETILFVFLFLLGSICITITYTSPFYLDLLNRHFELFVETYIITFLISIIPHRIRSFARGILCMVLYIIATIDIFCFIRLGSTLSANITQLILETNSNEVTNFINSYINKDILLSPVCLIISLAIIHSVVQAFLSDKINNIINRIYIRFRFFPLLLCIPIIWGGAFLIPNTFNRIVFFNLNSEKEIADFYASDYRRIKINYLPFYRLITSLYTNHLSQKQISTYLSHYQKIEVDSCKFLSPNIVLIIGESYNKHHSQLYGYQMPTTPFQIEEDLFIFQDAVTSHNLTSEVFKNLLSLNDYSLSEEWFKKPLFTQVFKTAGYRVSFISNQYILEDLVDFSAGAFINNSEISKLQFDQRNNTKYPFDKDLWKEFDRMNLKNKSNTLTIFHLIGQHNDYKERSPRQYQELSKKNYHRKDLSDDELSIVMAYDNATRYNDDVIKSFIKYFDETNTIILYLSDHGEECYDEIKTFGRSHNNQINRIIAKNEFEIPFWIWCSKKYKQSHPKLLDAISAATKKPFYSSDLGHLMLYLAGITCPYYLEEKNILSSSYNAKRKRLLRGVVYYEDLLDLNNVRYN